MLRVGFLPPGGWSQQPKWSGRKLPKKCHNQSSWTQHLTFLAAFQADVLQLSLVWAGTLYLGSTHCRLGPDLAEFLMQIFLITFRTFGTFWIWIHSVDFILFFVFDFIYWFFKLPVCSWEIYISCLLTGVDANFCPPLWSITGLVLFLIA